MRVRLRCGMLELPTRHSHYLAGMAVVQTSTCAPLTHVRSLLKFFAYGVAWRGHFFYRNQSLIPANKKSVPIQVRAATLVGERPRALLRKNQAVHDMA